MSKRSLDTTNKRALVAAIVASGTDDLNVMFLAFSMSSIITELGISGTQGGWIATITNLGMLAGGLILAYWQIGIISLRSLNGQSSCSQSLQD